LHTHFRIVDTPDRLRRDGPREPRNRRLTRVLQLATLWLVLVWVQPAHAYPWMIRHGYSGCGVCHTDPSGGFLLTAYGRAQTQTLLSTFGHGPAGDEVDSRSQFAWGAVPLPDWLSAGVAVRNLYLYSKPRGAPVNSRFVQMQADARVVVTRGDFEAAGSLGYVHEGAFASAVTRANTDNLVSREFWLGYRFGEDRSMEVRAGRLYLPFGLRMIEHNFFVRSVTQTDIDSQEQWGASFFRQGDAYRAEIMAILGNYQIGPDAYRQRGYSGYAELALSPRVGLGLSSLATYAKLDPALGVSAVRGAHGPYVRWVATPDLAVLAEADVVHRTPEYAQTEVGFVGLAQADWEFVHGLHGILSAELQLPQFRDPVSEGSHREWLTAAWFIYPHVDVRADAIWASELYGPQRVQSITGLGQLHVSL
jgi:hypothetical protein